MHSISQLANIINKPKNKGVKVIPRVKILHKSVLESAFKTHENLSIDDVEYMINLVLNMNMLDKDISNLILRTYKLTNTGRFSLTFNTKLDIAIKNRDKDKIFKLVNVSGLDVSWPELYYNKNGLTKQEKDDILKISTKEYFAILNSIQTAFSTNDFKNILPCVNKKDTIISSDEDGIYYNSLYFKCYKNICLYESEQIGKIVSTDNIIPSTAYINKYGEEDKYCFNLMELIERFARGNYINPITNILFSDITISQIKSKFGREIKMYQQYLLNLN